MVHDGKWVIASKTLIAAHAGIAGTGAIDNELVVDI